MKKVFVLEDLCCANCGAKIEEAVGKIEGVSECSVTFLTQKMTLEMEEDKLDSIREQVKKIVKKIEPDVEVIEK